jgi:hypothetical protein
VPYRSNLGELLVVGLAQYPLLERIQPIVQPEDSAENWVYSELMTGCSARTGSLPG